MDEWTAKYLEEWQVDFGDEPNAEQLLQWISLDVFFARLTRVQAAPLEDFALRTLNRAFDPGPYPSDEVEYQVPTGAAWMRIWRKELYVWTSSATEPGIDRARWDSWKRGFETCWKSENLQPETREAAGAAWRRMSSLETESHSGGMSS